jgi:hypothetical protein
MNGPAFAEPSVIMTLNAPDEDSLYEFFVYMSTGFMVVTVKSAGNSTQKQ